MRRITRKIWGGKQAGEARGHNPGIVGNDGDNAWVFAIFIMEKEWTTCVAGALLGLSKLRAHGA